MVHPLRSGVCPDRFSVSEKFSEDILRTATVLVKDEQKGGGVNGAAAFQDLFSLGGSTVDNEVGIFKSKRLMRTVVEILHLDISYKEWDGLRKKELYTSTPFAVTFLDATPSQQISLTVTMSDNGKVTLADMTLQNEEEEEEFDEILTVQPGDTVNTPVGKWWWHRHCLRTKTA